MDSPRDDAELAQYLAGVVVGPLEHVEIRRAEPDPAWPQRFAREESRIRAALGDGARVEHIGSTSVPGLPAKPVVDILLVLDDPADEPAYVPALEAAGYELRVREPGFWQHRMLRTPARDVHVHVLPPHSPEVERYLLFRDRLRADAADRNLYAMTKRLLAARRWPTQDHYAEAKSSVVEAIIGRARAARCGATGEEAGSA